MTVPKKFSLTTSIPYVHSKPHVGLAPELIEADVLVRHYRLAGLRSCFPDGNERKPP